MCIRDSPEDVPLLAATFLDRFATKNNKVVRAFTAEALDALTQHSWPGNVRELENAIERAVVLARGELIGVDDLPGAVRPLAGGRTALSFVVGTPLKVVERKMIEETLRHAGGDKVLAGNLLGITARTLYRREAEWAAADRGEPSGDGDPAQNDDLI